MKNMTTEIAKQSFQKFCNIKLEYDHWSIRTGKFDEDIIETYIIFNI